MGKITRIAEGVPQELVDIAQRQIYGDYEHVPARFDYVPFSEPTPPALRLDLVLQRLHDSKINAGLQTFAWQGLTAWIGDPINGKEAESVLGCGESGWGRPGSLAQWLHEAALRLYPDSEYAQRYGDGDGH
jgi:hypothetical protein